ncbi:regulatory protein, luxR family [Streptosporangium subroseum]|uniref:Regulatory protein, luxR family n=1 Tax=Streptosporangium subroseum TaxID=106412 RepID=A0A239NWL2_9ACTN|nr:regulatory protein, luxR family [Streptosporangium subroseum]
MGSRSTRHERTGPASHTRAPFVVVGTAGYVTGRKPPGLPPQQLRVIRLAAGGASNREIATRLGISPRTVGNHLYKAFPRLGIASRDELRSLLRTGHALLTDQ